MGQTRGGANTRPHEALLLDVTSAAAAGADDGADGDDGRSAVLTAQGTPRANTTTKVKHQGSPRASSRYETESNLTQSHTSHNLASLPKEGLQLSPRAATPAGNFCLAPTWEEVKLMGAIKVLLTWCGSVQSRALLFCFQYISGTGSACGVARGWAACK